MSSAKKNEKEKSTQVEQKVSRLREKQDKWMEERAIINKGSSNKNNLVHSSLKPYISSVSNASKQKKEVKKAEPLLWTAGTQSRKYEGFVVRNGSGNSNSRPTSAREQLDKIKTPSTKKTYTHSSLRDQSSRPTSAKSSNFVQSNKNDRNICQSDEGEISSSSTEEDESFSASFSEKFGEFQSENDYKYNSKRYEETGETYSPKCFENKSSNTENGQFMENHYCLGCRQLMYDEKHIPLMVFPCGHSLCSNCISGRSKCQSCNCDIISTEENHSLHTIISKFKKKQDREELEKKEKKVRKYLEEYNNLNTRIDLMKGMVVFEFNVFQSIYLIMKGISGNLY